ncbi:MAG: sulfatase-like hydrolase/transferase [Clostridiales bacterium]
MAENIKKKKELLKSFGQFATAKYCLFLIFSIIYLECVLRFYTLNIFWGRGLVYIILFSVPIGFLVVLLSSLGNKKVNVIISGFCLFLITLLFMTQIVYFTIFDTYFTLYSLTGTGDVLEFWHQGLNGIKAGALPLFFGALPMFIWAFWGRKWVADKSIKFRYGLGLLIAAFLMQFIAVVAVNADDNGVMSRRYLYKESFVPRLCVANFGALTTYGLDLKNLTLGMGDTVEVKENTEISKSHVPQNVLEIDFDSLIAGETDEIIKDMHQYFSTAQATAQNQYTGKYAGKNLIWICAEGFSAWALDAKKTPTLYKMANQGYVFKNFYNPIWGVSTSDGEYTTCTGLIPKPGVWSLYKSGENYMPFCLGNQLQPRGYTTRAYHDHTYSYYHREVSHPNMGYNYKGVGNGLELRETWPESDVEMMEKTIPEYINDELFHTYYMSVSGHLEYTFVDNAMAAKHKDEVEDLPYSPNVKAYLACQMELDKAMELLLKELNKAGKLDDTLIVLAGDHYPYGLTNEEISEINGETVEENFGLYHTALIMWESSMAEPVIVKKPCSPIDILPTLSNLLGVPYDSRLMMGKDIFSDSPGLVVFADHSWLTDKGRYNALTNEFIPNKGVKIPKDYAKNTMVHVNAMFDYSAKILDYNYYSLAVPQNITAHSGTVAPKLTKEEKAAKAMDARKNQVQRDFKRWNKSLGQ